MKPRYFPMLGSIFAFTAAGGLLLPSAAPALSTEVESNEDVEVLTRGPVHEAFAESVSYEPEAGMIVASAPPALIEELPPEQQPEGDNVTWISGYWAWDDDQSDFLWISGIWRNIPPGREWVPGYWDELDGAKYQWVSGYWQDPEEEETTYIATAPPKSVDTGPNIDAPDEDQTWIPGNWRYQETRYVWSPGYYTPLRPNWTWVPSRYSWSPRGYVYVDGYWDYAVVNRGVLFAPVHYRRHVWETPGYYYTPSIVVSLNVFAEHLFIRPRCGHYYFGDYYAPRYRDSGFYTPFAWHRGHRGYDPIWAYQRWHHRHDRGWERNYENNYNYFRDNDRARPPHTWAAMRSLQNERFDDDRGRSRLFANSFDGYVKNPDRGQKFKALNQERRQQFVAQGKQMREFTRQRKEVEARPIAAVGDGEGKKSVKEKLRRSPVMGRQASQLAENERPPQRPEGRKGRAGAGAGAANDGGAGDNTAPGDDGKLTQKEKMRRAAGGGGANKGGDGATGPDADGPGKGKGANADTDGDGTLSQKEKMRRAAGGGGANKGGDGATGPDADGPGKGKGANADTDGDGTLSQKEKMRRAAGGGGANKGGDGATGPDADGPGNKGAPSEGATDDGKLTQKEKLRRAAGKGEGQPEPKVNPAPRKEQAEPKVVPQKKEQPERQVAPKREVQPQPKREVQPTPQRKAQPERQQPQPKPQVREAPQKKQAAPQREVQPKPPQVQPRKQQQKPERKEKEEASRQPQRNPQIAAQRMAQPKPQARQAPVERKQASQPKPQVRQQAAAQPRKQQQAAPQRQAQRQQPQARQATQPRQQATRQAPQQGEARKKKGERDKANN